MARFRLLLVWLLVFALPMQAAAASSMMQCQDMQASRTATTDGAAPAHDHAAMMKAMAEGEDMSHDMHAGMDHGDMDMDAPDNQRIGTSMLSGSWSRAPVLVGMDSIIFITSRVVVSKGAQFRRPVTQGQHYPKA